MYAREALELDVRTFFTLTLIAEKSIVVKTVVKWLFLRIKKPRNLNDFKAFHEMLMAGLEPARSGSRGF